MDKTCTHQRFSCDSKREFYLHTCAFPNLSTISDLNVSSMPFQMANGYNYHTNLCATKDKITFNVGSNYSFLKCIATMSIGSETILVTDSVSKPTRNPLPNQPPCYYYDFISLSSEDDAFQKIKQHRNDRLVVVCRVAYSTNASNAKMIKTSDKTATDTLYNLQPLAAALKSSVELFAKQKIFLRVGEESEIVSKALLCARSPVFAKMFESDMKELKENIVKIPDVQMNVLKVLVSYLYTGKLPNGDSDLASTCCYFDFICDLYYAADKYDIEDLRQLCVDILLPKISMQNAMRALRLAFAHNDVRLKSTVMILFTKNIDALVLTQDWKQLINDEPKIVAEILNFFQY